MREFESSFPAEGFNKGLRNSSSNPQNDPALVECFNVGPGKFGPELHKPVISFESTQSWGGRGLEQLPALTRSITIVVRDYVSEADVEGAEVYIDGVSVGAADVNGEVNIPSIEIGGHSIRIVKTGYFDTTADDLLNDYFVVT